MFKVEITEETTEICGSIDKVLIGLACYVRALKENNVPKKLILKAVDLGFKDKKEVTKEAEEIDKRNKEIDKKIENILKKIFEN